VSDIVVTVPLWFGLDVWIEEGDAAGEPWSGQLWDFSVAGAQPDIQPGERVYIVFNKRLRGYAPLVRLEQAGPRYWYLIRGGGAVACTIGESIVGFRGWRRRWWEYCNERPFPEWKTP
jgi:hypothetical protein